MFVKLKSISIGLLFWLLPSTPHTGPELGIPANRVLMEFQGNLYPSRFLGVRGEPFGHHAIAWKEGRAAKRALIITDISDKTVAETLAAKGLRGGNNLEEDTWDSRKDKENPAADERVEGASLEVFVSWGGAEPIDLKRILGLADADFRFGDHRSLIPVWRSGCIVCAVSCPGAKVSNRSLTVRDQTEGLLRKKLRLMALPPEGTPVTVFLLRKP